jgi:hypothetical protein
LDPNDPSVANAYGVFEAPESGGYVSAFAVTIKGARYDVPRPATDNNAPTYNPTLNAIGAPGTDPSVPALVGHAGAFNGLVLNMFHDHTYNLNYRDSGIAGDDTGTYVISPVPFDPATMLEQLAAEVKGAGADKTLANKVKFAQTYYAAGDNSATCALLSDDFVSTVNELAGEKKLKLSSELASQLIADAKAIMAAIGCN